MTLTEKAMARLLSRRARISMFDPVLARVSPKVSTILDLGCGVGALAGELARKFPSSMIVGVDMSKYLLLKLQRKGIALTVLADIRSLPFKEGIFDVAIAIQVLSEVVSLKVTGALIQTLKNVHFSLRSDGEFIICDHVSPGDAPILLRLSDQMLTKLREFKTKFKHHYVNYQDQGEGVISTTMRDLYDFLTKIWALSTDLEDEEMNETHTPFTPEELQRFLLKAGFKVQQIVNVAPVPPVEGLFLQSDVELPGRQIVAVARK